MREKVTICQLCFWYTLCGDVSIKRCEEFEKYVKYHNLDEETVTDLEEMEKEKEYLEEYDIKELEELQKREKTIHADGRARQTQLRRRERIREYYLMREKRNRRIKWVV